MRGLLYKASANLLLRSISPLLCQTFDDIGSILTPIGVRKG
jgi:hypothetical protein